MNAHHPHTLTPSHLHSPAPAHPHSLTTLSSTVPVFVQMYEKWRQMYVGVCEGGGLKTNFSTVHLRYIPPQFNHLSGLLDIFKSKLVSPV